MSEFDGFVFLDLETTGLDPVLDSILEVGILVTDKEFQTIVEFSQVCYFDLELNKNSIDEVVLEMHTKNGLWEECGKSELNFLKVEEEAIKFLKDGGWDKQPLAGNTINFDRSFLHAQMPRLESTFHYRNFDVSTVRQLFAKFGWAWPPAKENPAAHRGLADCHDSKQELHYFVNEIQGWQQW